MLPGQYCDFVWLAALHGNICFNLLKQLPDNDTGSAFKVPLSSWFTVRAQTDTGNMRSACDWPVLSAALERHTATLPDEEVQDQAEQHQERQDGTAAIKEPTTGGDFTTSPNEKRNPLEMTNGLSNRSPHAGSNGVASDEVVPLANGEDPHVDPNDPHFLIPPKFSSEGVNPPLQHGLPIAGIGHPHTVPVPAHIHVDSHSAGPTHAEPQPQPQPAETNSRRSLDKVAQSSRKSLDMTGSRKNLRHGSKTKLGTGMSLSQMMSQKQLQAGSSGVSAGQKGMVLPFDPLHLSFHDLNYYVPLPQVQFLAVSTAKLTHSCCLGQGAAQDPTHHLQIAHQTG